MFQLFREHISTISFPSPFLPLLFFSIIPLNLAPTKITMEFVSKLAEKFLDKDKSSGSQEGYGNQGGYGGGDQGYGGGYPQQQQHSGPQVPPPWVARWDGESQRWFYVNEQTGERTWNHPGQGGGYGQPQPSYGGGAPYGGEQSYGQQPSYGYGESRQGDFYQQQEEPKKDHTAAKIAGAAVLGVAGGALGAYGLHEARMSFFFFSPFTAIFLSDVCLLCNGTDAYQMNSGMRTRKSGNRMFRISLKMLRSGPARRYVFAFSFCFVYVYFCSYAFILNRACLSILIHASGR